MYLIIIIVKKIYDRFAAMRFRPGWFANNSFEANQSYSKIRAIDVGAGMDLLIYTLPAAIFVCVCLYSVKMCRKRGILAGFSTSNFLISAGTMLQRRGEEGGGGE